MKESVKGETIDVMETILFTKIYERHINKSKPKDILPVIAFLKTESKHRLTGINSFLYFREVNQSLTNIIMQN